MKNVIITGGTGLLGMRLSHFLSERGCNITHLSRKENLSALFPAYKWNIDQMQMDERALLHVDAVIHLAGANIADSRWSDARKQELLDSRIKSTELLARKIAECSVKPKAFIACSAVGIYGNRGEEILTESSSKGEGFMSEICRLWEKSAALIRDQGVRTPVIRVGVVLSTLGGALSKIKMSYPFRVGSYFGNGSQFYPWIHIDDICKLFHKALTDDSMKSTYNGTAPSPATNKELAEAISFAKNNKNIIIPVPAYMVRLLMGEMSEVVLNSCRAIPSALMETDFQFNHPDLNLAVKDLFDRNI